MPPRFLTLGFAGSSLFLIPFNPGDIKLAAMAKVRGWGLAFWAKQGKELIYLDFPLAFWAINTGGDGINFQFSAFADSVSLGYWPRAVKSLGDSA